MFLFFRSPAVTLCFNKKKSHTFYKLMLDQSAVIRNLAGKFFILSTPSDDNFGILAEFATWHKILNVSEYFSYFTKTNFKQGSLKTKFSMNSAENYCRKSDT